MTWNYRLIRYIDPSGEITLIIKEVYYKDGDQRLPDMIGDASVQGSSKSEIAQVLDSMMQALDKPILNYGDIALEVD